MALLLFRIAIGAERFPLDLDRSGSLGLLGSFGHHLLFHGSGRSRGLGRGNNRFRDRGLFISRLFGCFRGFRLHRGFRGGLDRFDFGFGCFYGSGVSNSFFSAAAAFLVVEAVFLAVVLRAAVFLAADASGAPVSNGFFAIKFQVKERIMNQFRRLSRFITEPHPEEPGDLSTAPCTFPNQKSGPPPPSH